MRFSGDLYFFKTQVSRLHLDEGTCASSPHKGRSSLGLVGLLGIFVPGLLGFRKKSHTIPRIPCASDVLAPIRIPPGASYSQDLSDCASDFLGAGL